MSTEAEMREANELARQLKDILDGHTPKAILNALGYSIAYAVAYCADSRAEARQMAKDCSAQINKNIAHVWQIAQGTRKTNHDMTTH